MSQKIRCANANCRRLFLPDPRVKGQRYCSRKTCQRLRKRQWQHHKINHDPDYRDNHRDGQQAWLERNPGYWRRYREHHPGYVNRNRLLQRGRDMRRRRLSDLAKMDPSRNSSFVKPGSYYLISSKSTLAKMDPLSPKYFLIPQAYPFLAKKDSMDLPAFSDVGCPPRGGHSP